jgi:DNA modification methylase
MITEKRELKNVPLADLIPYARNPRKNDPAVQRVAASLKEYGLVKNSIVVDEDMVLITGHTTTKAMQALKWATAPEVTQVFGLTEAQKKAYRIADNKLGELAAWDDELLALELDDLKVLDFDLDLTGFDDKELGKILDAGKEASEDDYEPPVEIETSIQRGDLFALGRHRLLCGDSTSAEDVARLLEGNAPFIMVTDPPYGVEYDPRWRLDAGLNKEHQTRAEGKVTNDDKASWKEAWDLFPGVVAYVWHGALHSTTVALDLMGSKFEIRAQIVWAKPSLVIGRGAYHWQHEPCWYASRGTAKWNGDRKQSTVWSIPNMHRTQGDVDDGKTMHGTQKPVECMARPIRNHGGKDDDVYDPFLGSGTTLVACEQLGRTCYGMEISPQYCQVIIDRWEKLTGQKAEKVDGD